MSGWRSVVRAILSVTSGVSVASTLSARYEMNGFSVDRLSVRLCVRALCVCGGGRSRVRVDMTARVCPRVCVCVCNFMGEIVYCLVVMYARVVCAMCPYIRTCALVCVCVCVWMT